MVQAQETGPGRGDDEVLREVSRQVEEHRRRGESIDLDAILSRFPPLRQNARLLCRAFSILRSSLLTASDAPESAETELVGKTPAPLPRSSPPLSAEPDRPPRELGDFRLLRELGRGGMGCVYLAVQKGLNRLVAVKVLSGIPGLWRAEAVERFLREVEVVASLRHPNIVQVYAAGEENGVPYYAMEYVCGPSLEELLRELGDPATRAPEQLPDLLAYVIQAAEALQSVHDSGIVHRDVKPSNLLLEEDGVLKVVDFGLARVRDAPSLTRTGTVVGTPHYMSPEALRGDTRVDHRADVYSLGAVLYQVLTRQTPWEGATPEHIYYLAATRDPKPPRRINPRVTRDLETITLKALEKDPGKRYQSARELAADLKRFLRYEPIQARPPGLATRALKFIRRRRAASAAVLLVLVLALAFGLWNFLSVGFLEIEAGDSDLTVVVATEDDRGGESEQYRISPPTPTPLELRTGKYLVRSFADQNWHRYVAIEISSRHTTRVLASAPKLAVLWQQKVQGPVRAVLVADLDGKGPAEVIVSTGQGIHVLEAASGRLLATFQADALGLISTPPAIADLDGDGRLDLVAATWHGKVARFEVPGDLAERGPAAEARRIGPHVPPFHKEGAQFHAPVVVVQTAGGAHRIVAGDYRGSVYVLDNQCQLAREFALDGSVLALSRIATQGGQVAAVCGNGKVYSIDPDGNESPKETVPPQFVAAGQAGLVGAPVLADSDGDGRSEVFVATSSGSSGTLLCSDQEGRGRWRRDHSSSFAKGPVVGGPDRRGRLRVLAGGSDGMVLCCDAQTGRVQWTWQFDQTVNGGLAFADLDGDGLHDVLAGDTAGSLCAVSGTESPTLWVRRVHHEVGDSPVLLDLDGSGTSSILYTGQVDCVTCLRGNGALSWRFPTRGWVVGGVTASDLDGDRRPEVLFGSFDRRVYCLRGGADSARSLWQEGGRDGLFVGREVAARPLVVDLERDERLEVLVGDWNHDLHCFAPSGERRWPRPAGGRLSNEPRLGLLLAEDLDADGILELIAIDETNKLCCFARQPGGGTWGAIWRFESSQLPRFLHNQRTQRLELVVREAIGDRLVVLGAAGEVSRVLLHGKGIAVHYWTLDLNGDGGTEVLALDDVSGFPLRALSPDGAERWRIDLGSDSTCEPALSDFDGDGVDELLVLLQSGEGKFLDPKTGALLGGLDLGVKKAHGFAVGNVGDDKRPEIVVAGADQCLYCFRVPEGTISR